MAKRESLRAYQDGILAKMESARMNESGQFELLFGFRAAEKNFLINGKDIIEMALPTKLEPVPVAKPWAVGAANIKGSVYIVTDFSVLIGSYPIKSGRFLLLSPEVMSSSAIRIETITGLYEPKNTGVQVEDESMKSMPDFITSCHEIAGQKHYLINTALLAMNTKFSKLQSGETQ